VIQPSKATELAFKLHTYFADHRGTFHLFGPVKAEYKILVYIDGATDDETMDFMNCLELTELDLIGSHRTPGGLRSVFRWGQGDFELVDALVGQNP